MYLYLTCTVFIEQHIACEPIRVSLKMLVTFCVTVLLVLVPSYLACLSSRNQVESSCPSLLLLPSPFGDIITRAVVLVSSLWLQAITCQWDGSSWNCMWRSTTSFSSNNYTAWQSYPCIYCTSKSYRSVLWQLCSVIWFNLVVLVLPVPDTIMRAYS